MSRAGTWIEVLTCTGSSLISRSNRLFLCFFFSFALDQYKNLCPYFFTYYTYFIFTLKYFQPIQGLNQTEREIPETLSYKDFSQGCAISALSHNGWINNVFDRNLCQTNSGCHRMHSMVLQKPMASSVSFYFLFSSPPPFLSHPFSLLLYSHFRKMNCIKLTVLASPGKSTDKRLYNFTVPIFFF